MSSMSSPGDSPQATAASLDEGYAKAPRLPARPIQRGATLRRALLTRLAPLAVTADSAGAMKVDSSAADLDADAFIGPLHAIVAEGQR